jgi:hypothetical protein
MAVLEYERWWRMPDTPRTRGRRRASRAALWFIGYWAIALGAAYAIHIDWLPARRLLLASEHANAPPPAPARTGHTVAGLPPDAETPQRSTEPLLLAATEPDPVSDEDPTEALQEPERSEEPAPETERASEPERSSEQERALERERAERAQEARAERAERRREARERAKRQRAERRAERERAERERAERAQPEEREVRAESRSLPPPPRSRRLAENRQTNAKPSSGGGTSCEAAIGAYRESIRMGDRSTPPDITQARYAAVLDNGSYFQHCGVPESTAIRICAAVQKGRAVGVTVSTVPASASQQRCIANAVRGLSFPSHPRMDVTTTVFE